MSWHGSHPVISKTEAIKLLPKKYCNICVYWTRVSRVPPMICGRCSSGEDDKIWWRYGEKPRFKR